MYCKIPFIGVILAGCRFKMNLNSESLYKCKVIHHSAPFHWGYPQSVYHFYFLFHISYFNFFDVLQGRVSKAKKGKNANVGMKEGNQPCPKFSSSPTPFQFKKLQKVDEWRKIWLIINGRVLFTPKYDFCDTWCIVFIQLLYSCYMLIRSGYTIQYALDTPLIRPLYAPNTLWIRHLIHTGYAIDTAPILPLYAFNTL